MGGCGFVVRVLDEGGLVFEETEATTLDEGMTALERGIAEQSDDEGIGRNDIEAKIVRSARGSREVGP